MSCECHNLLFRNPSFPAGITIQHTKNLQLQCYKL